MNRFIQKINKYLLERYPLLWNTRIVWMLASSIILHLLFFLGGYLALTDVTKLHKHGAVDMFLNNGTVFMGIIISILQVAIWLIFLLKNNAFKNYYPTTRKGLWLQFVLFFLTFFVCTTYYYSYTAGIKAHTAIHYPDEEFEQDIRTANEAHLFFSQSIYEYTLENVAHPSVLDTLHCEANSFYVQDSLPHFSFEGRKWQYYTLEKKVFDFNDFGRNFYRHIDSLQQESVYNIRKDSSIICYFRNEVVDVKDLIKNPNPSYYNFSGRFFSTSTAGTPYYGYSVYQPDLYYNDTEYLMEDEYDYYRIRNFISEAQRDSVIKRKRLRNMENQALLDRNDPAEIKGKLENLLLVADKYEVPHNLETDAWFTMVYHPPLFDLKSRIRPSKKSENGDLYVDEEAQMNKFEKHSREILTNYYFETTALKRVFENIDEIKNDDIFNPSIHFFLWISFMLACVLFAFRVTNIKALLFAIISAGVLTMLVALVMVLISFMESNFEILVQYFIFVIASIILGLSLFFVNKISKVVQAVAVVLSVIGFVPYVLLIISIISTHQRRQCSGVYYNIFYNDEYCFVLMNYLGHYLSLILFIIGLLFIFFYSGQIKKWKAQAES
ncbi:hypothetical protein POV27_06170 [Aureisphaera galaxeae]|uniref:hypothetical protein n=1 Tax=Aureisphaera galaxeae TaxID=1538023 RepID=UPI00234FFF5C|nr:hypothetical protein [Aureisphaera galaxeae]MDC8003629.1 hypothetical protein [Aureisphaera galaxeae]